MSNTINVNYMSGMISQYSKTVSKKSSVDSKAAMSDAIEKASAEKTAKSEETAAVKTISKGELSDAEKLEQFKKEVWKEIDSMPWNRGINTSIQITDSAFERMMNDEDFKDRMFDYLNRASRSGRSPITSSLLWIDENGVKGYAYLDEDAGKLAFSAHSKDKDSFYVKKAKQQEVNDAYEKTRVRRQEQKEYREKKYQASQYLKDVLAHQDEVARLFEEKYNTSGVI